MGDKGRYHYDKMTLEISITVYASIYSGKSSYGPSSFNNFCSFQKKKSKFFLNILLFFMSH